MMWRLSGCGRLGLILGAFVLVAPVSGWARAPKEAPDEAKLQEAAPTSSCMRPPKLQSEIITDVIRGQIELSIAISAIEDLGAHHPKMAEVRQFLVLLRKVLELLEENKYATSIPLMNQACSSIRKLYGTRSSLLRDCHSFVAILYLIDRRPEKAQLLLEQELADNEAMLGPEDLEVACSLWKLATCHLIKKEFKKSEKYLKRALTINEKVLGSDHLQVANYLDNLATLYSLQQDRETSGTHLERALTIWKEELGPGHPIISERLAGLAALYAARGQYGKAKFLLSRELAAYEKELGPDHANVATILNAMAQLYHKLGEYERAEQLMERALVIREQRLGIAHPDTLTILGNWGSLLVDQGDYGRAEMVLERVLAIREQSLGPHHLDIASSLNNLATLLYEAGEYTKAESLLERALAISERELGRHHPLVAANLENLASLHVTQGEYAKAQPLLKRSLAILERELGPGHPDVAICLTNLAISHYGSGEHELAEQLLTRALAISENALGHDHPLGAAILSNLSILYRSLGRHDSAVSLSERVLDIEQKRISETFLLAEERRRLDFAVSMSAEFYHTLSFHQAAPAHQPSAELALTTLLRRKGLVLDLGARSAAAVRRSLPEDFLYLLDALVVSRDRYIALASRGPDPRTAERLAAIQREQQRLWRKIAEHSSIVESLYEPLTINDIQRVLPSDTALIEFIRYQALDHTSIPMVPIGWGYAAYLIFPDHFDWIDLGPAEPIEQHVKAFRRAVQLKQAVPTDLHDAVIQPILDRISDTRRLFIAPDAELNLIPFGALYDGEHYLVEHYDLHYLTTGRDLLRPWDAYGPTDDDTVMVVANPTGASLPGTEQEADLLEVLFPRVETLLRDTATEAGAQRRAQPWMLHFGTHGFFEIPKPDPEFEHRMDEYVLSMSPSSLPFAPGRLDNPMMHSGLLLASTGTSLDTDKSTADGRLTAYEISGWDLRGTELVVLSACGSGLGEPRAGEGVLGLRRAFAMAGAQTQVMSLWDVSDATTAKLMDAYYRKLLAGKGRAEAMQEVQLEMLRSGEHHPGDWASFVVVGEWRPLSKTRLPEPEGPPPAEPRGSGCQRASVGGDEQPPGVLVLGMLGLLIVRRRRLEVAT